MPGTYRIQSLAYHLEQAERRAGILHIEGRGLHGFRRMVAGDMYEILGDAELAMEFINDTSAMTKTYILRRMPRIVKSAEAADAALRLRKALAEADSPEASRDRQVQRAALERPRDQIATGGFDVVASS
jgi:hypothetical protein